MTRTVDLGRMKDACGFTATYTCKFGNTRKANIAGVTLNKNGNGQANGNGSEPEAAPQENGRAEAKAKERMKLSKTLIVSPEYDAIKSYQGEIRSWVYGQSVPSFFKEGFQLVSLKQIERDGVKTSAVEIIEKKMRQSQTQLAALVETFLAAYPAQVEASRAILEPVGQFNPSDYPATEDLRKMFSITWAWIAFAVPEGLPEEIRKAEADKLEQSMKDAGEQITQALRAAFAKLVEHAKSALEPDTDGKKKIFRDSVTGNLLEFINTFGQRDLMNDVELAQLVGKAREILAGVTPQKLRDYEDIREETAKQFADMGAQLETMVEKKPNRKFDLDDN